jgi:hypothetical protein
VLSKIEYTVGVVMWKTIKILRTCKK